MTLFISDLDGTLLNTKAKINKRTYEMLNRLIEKGVMFTYATARSFASAGPLVSEINLNVPAIIFNGVFIVDPKTGEHLIENRLSDECMDWAKLYFVQNDMSPLVYSNIDGQERVSYLEERRKDVKSYLDARKTDKRMRSCKDWDELFEGDIFYFTLINPKKTVEELDEVFNSANGFARNYQADTYDKSEFWYEIYDKNVSKANAVKQLKEYVGADKLVCFGDNINDISMIKAADIGCAVSNACDELKQVADRVIGENNADAVPVFIEQFTSKTWAYESRKGSPPDKERYEFALKTAREHIYSTIGTYNEKLIHATLKNYFSPFSNDQEIKIGKYFADAMNDNGIYEIQTQAFGKLNGKLGDFTDFCHVTVVYPFTARSRNIYVDSNTGEILQTNAYRNYKSLTDFFIELYRIKGYLTNPNVTICIARLTIDEMRYVDGEIPTGYPKQRKKKMQIEKVPVELTEEIYLESADDYRQFLPEGLPEEFTLAELKKLCKNIEPSILMQILTYVGVVKRSGKKGNAFLYKIL